MPNMTMDMPPAPAVRYEVSAESSVKPKMDFSKLEALSSVDESSYFQSLGKEAPSHGKAPDEASRENFRQQSVREAGFSAGARAGLAWATKVINKGLELVARNLDRVYDFSPLIIEQRVIPPVLTELRDVMTQEGDDTILTNGRTYKIAAQAKFSSRAPHWRNYLWRSYDSDSLLPDPELLPRNSEEKSIWRVAVGDGWSKGVEQANEIFDSNMSRLDRDYRGMVRYHMLAMQNMVTIPVVAEARLPVNATGEAMDLDGQLFRLTAVPQFNGNRTNWTPLVLEKQKLEQPNDSLRDGPKPVVLWDSRLDKVGKPAICAMCSHDEKGELLTTTKLNASRVDRLPRGAVEPKENARLDSNNVREGAGSSSKAPDGGTGFHKLVPLAAKPQQNVQGDADDQAGGRRQDQADSAESPPPRAINSAAVNSREDVVGAPSADKRLSQPFDAFGMGGV